MEKLLCPNCKNNSVVKNGFQNKKQRYKCKDCGNRFQADYTYKAYKYNINSIIKSLLKEGCGVRSIGRVLNIFSKTVLSRMLKISKLIKIPYFNKFGCPRSR